MWSITAFTAMPQETELICSNAGKRAIMKKLCLFILSVLIIFASGCNKADIGKNDANNNSEQNTISGAAEQNKEHIGSKFMGVWYYTNYSSPDYADDFEKIEIVPCGEDKAKVLWADGTEDIFEIISENEGIGAYGEIGKARYCIDNEDGAEHFNVVDLEDGPIFQPGAGGYRVVPSIYESKTVKMKTELKDWFNTLSQKEIPDAPQQTMNVKSGEIYDEWDRLLNEIYGYLKETMSQSEFTALQKDEQNWIKQKENAINEAGKEYEGGSMAPLARNSVGIEYTKERCEYLLSLIK